ncbi:MAG: AbrB/MazE/SpoVT family DNA-binding domain-containing protein [Thermoplasmatales archaeon]|nr:AbrB/MazE/SpoVT family DNA-binding domain-containing protein [Thermoplasmatales archaeon]
MKCRCGEKTMPVEINVGSIKVKGWRCSKCNENYVDEKSMEKAIELNKIMKTAMVSKIYKSGNSYAFRIPKKAVDVLGLETGKNVSMRITPESIVLDIKNQNKQYLRKDSAVDPRITKF